MQSVPAVGEILFDRYLIEEVLDVGAHTALLRSRDTRLDVPGLITMLYGDDSATDWPMRREAFVNAFRSQARLNHPNIVHVSNIELRGGKAASVLELLPGVTLDRYLNEGQEKLSPREVLELFLGVVDAFVLAHGEGVFHLGIAPCQILLTEQGKRLSPRIMNFSLRRDLEELDPEVHLPYLAPEQFRDENAGNEASDIFGLCASIVFALTNVPPVRLPNLEAYRAFYARGGLNCLPAGIPSDFVPLLQSGLMTDPARRLSSASLMLKELKRIGKNYNLSANLTIETSQSYAKLSSDISGTYSRPPSGLLRQPDVFRPKSSMSNLAGGTSSEANRGLCLPASLAENYVLRKVVSQNAHAVVADVTLKGNPPTVRRLKWCLSNDERVRSKWISGARMVEMLSKEDAYFAKIEAIDEGACALVMGNVPCQSLLECLKQNGRFSQEVAVQIAILLAQALDKAHQKGVVIENLKPSNLIFETQKGVVMPVIYDCGQRLIEKIDDLDVSEMPYMAPELGWSLVNANVQSDIFAFTMCVIEMLLGKKPYQAQSKEALMQEISGLSAVPALETSGLHPSLVQVLAWGTAFEPSNRYASFSELVRDFYVVFQQLSQEKC